MTVEEAFRIVENLDHPEGLRRKLAPAYSLLQVNRDGEVVSVERFKALPTDSQKLAAPQKHRGCIQLNGNPGLYESVDDLRKEIDETMWLFDRLEM